jgi:hypothetical protein
VHLETRGDLARADALVGERGDLPDAADVAHERGDDPDQLTRARPVRALEQRLGRAEGARDVATSPRIRHGEDRRLGTADGELLDSGARDRLAVRPGRELHDLGGEVADVVSDSLDERAAGVAIGGRAEPRELLADPLWQLLLPHLVRVRLAGLRDGFRECGVLLEPVADEDEDGVGGGRDEVRLDLLDVGGLP